MMFSLSFFPSFSDHLSSKSCSFFVHYVSASFQTHKQTPMSRYQTIKKENDFIFRLFSCFSISFWIVQFVVREPQMHSSVSLARNHLRQKIALLELEALECDWCKQKILILFLVIWNAAKANKTKRREKCCWLRLW